MTHADEADASLADGASISVEFECNGENYVGGVISSNQDLTCSLQFPKPGAPGTWLTVESETAVASTPLGYDLRIPGNQVKGRMLLANGSGSTATVSYSVTTRRD